MLQKQVAARIGVREETILNWERNKTEPDVQYWPAIMDFLGYCPYRRAESFGDLIYLYRTHRGLSHRKLAEVLGVDPGSISRWETGERKPYPLLLKKLADHFGMSQLSATSSKR